MGNEHWEHRQKQLKILNASLCTVFVLSYLLMLIFAWKESPALLLRMLSLSTTAFLLVSLIRYLVAAPRPSTEEAKKKRSHSFPSRHTFSAFYLAALAFRFSTAASILLYVAAICMGATRVFLGLHHKKDVVAGAALGVLLAVLSLLLM